MKVFISWSGTISEKIAVILSEFLPYMVPGTEMWMSKRNVEAGEFWPATLRQELADTDYGILCLTSENLYAPWILFEAGALSRNTEQSRVVPLLYDVEIGELPSPLRYFQAKYLNKEDIKEVVEALNRHSRAFADERRLDHNFETWWPQLEERLDTEITQLLTRWAYKFYAERFGVGHQRVSFECIIAPDGTAEVYRQVEVEAFSDVRSLDTVLFFLEAGAEVESGGLELVRVTSLQGGREVQCEQRKETPHLLANNLIFDPPLQAGEETAYQMVERANNQVFRLFHQHEGKSAVPEYFGWSIFRPTQRLELTIRFPEEEQPGDPVTQVRRASSSGQLTNPLEQREMRRVGKPALTRLPDGRYQLKLVVDYPVHGFVYTLVWQPESAL